MKNANDQCARIRVPSLQFFKLGIISILSLVLMSCAYVDTESTESARKQLLLGELERNQALWAESGVSEYSFSIHKECENCPDSLNSQLDVTVTEEDEEDLEDWAEDGESTQLSKAGGLSSRALSARDDEDDKRRTQTAQTLRVESLFTDLRQAILQNSVRQVNYNPTFGFPQTVLVNNALAQPINAIRTVDRDDDDDDDNANLLAIQARNFQVLSRNNAAQNLALNGQLIRQVNPTNNLANQYWLVGNNGQFNQVNVPANLYPTVNALPNRSFVQASGQWLPGGAIGQGQINLRQLTPNQNSPFQNNLNGTLFYTVQNQNNGSFNPNSFYVTSDAGRNVFLDLPANLQNRAIQLAGQRVNLNGNWTPNFTAPNARFIPSGLNTQNTTLEQFSGILMNGSGTSIPGLQQSNYILVDDFGSTLVLQIPNTIASNLYTAVGQRVTVLGTRINSGAFGQSVIYVQSFNQQQNIFTTSQISGTISAVLPSDALGLSERISVQLNTGNSIIVEIPSVYRDPYTTLTAGMRIVVSGAYINNAGAGQGIFQARAPIQVTSFGNTTNATFTGYITNIGSFQNNNNCNATQTTYGFTSDTGQQYQLYVGTSTIVNGLNTQGINLPLQARVQVRASQIAPGVLQAQTIDVAPQTQTTLSGTIIEIGAAGSTFTCTGALYTYRLLDATGNAYSITISPSTTIQGLQGGSLRIGDTVQVSGSLGNNGTTFYATQVYSIGTANTGFPFQNNLMTFTGIVTGLDCSNGTTDTYNFVDSSGTLYRVVADLNVQAGLYIDVGTPLQITGSVTQGSGINSNNEIRAQQISQLATFADPVNRIPVYGTILSTTGSLPTNCNTPVYTYQFQNDNGQIQELRLTTEAAQHLPQPIASGSRITIVSSVDSFNTQRIDALEIQFQSTGGSFGFGSIGQNVSVIGTVTGTVCNNEFYFVDQNGMGYQLQLGTSNGNFAGIGTRLNVTGQIVGNRLIATTIFPDTSAGFVPVMPPISGTITSIVNNETLSCGATVNTYMFQNDNGRQQQVRVVNSQNNFSGQFVTVGSRISINQYVESFNGSTLDAISINTQQAFF